jgi:hypothetical protein
VGLLEGAMVHDVRMLELVAVVRCGVFVPSSSPFEGRERGSEA